MAELSTGSDDKRSGSFKLFGKSPSRTVSSKKSSNPFIKIFTRSSKKIDKQNIPDYDENDPSDAGDAYNYAERIEEAVPTIIEKVEEAVPKVIEEVVRHANLENLVNETTIANPVAQSKETTPETDEKKPDFFHKLKDKAEKAVDKLQEKAKEGLQKLTDEGKEAYEALAQKGKASDEQPQDDKNSKVRSADIDDEAKVPLSSLAQGLEDEAVVVARAATAQATPEDEASHGENIEKDLGKQEENCVTYLAEGLQKICGQWTNNKKED